MKPFHIQVWQAIVPDFLARHVDFFPACNVYRHVADLMVLAPTADLALEGAFRCSQHGLHPAVPEWTQAPEVTLLHDATARSTSVGDVLVLDGVAYGVMDAGFKTIGEKQ